ncbi:transcriptional regulator [Actinobacteria bacterium YIM 96077]|uniref:Transcriptional regulator n=1 Tax=Phytoactinopolyspora halophila TaxID=1981511 RepID=A0A329QZW0_9ACTN|nr:transcriptional regulator [Phytoactinopolyspora halophila]AYY11643.1 transcriptional regulator [Actinobacteria bacterium YIM 96077]RAW17924.1 transcriptional regulator [Phytoactinopolyspora halophila]
MHHPATGTTREEITIGVVGADEVVRRTMAVARESGNTSWRLVAAVYDDEQEAHTQAMKIASRVDVCLFAGPLPYDVATSRGDLPVPATYVPVGGSAFYATLLRGALNDTFDPRYLSVDSVSATDVHTAYREIDVDSSHVHVQEYVRPESASEFLGFHRDLYERGETTGAITTVPTVATGLADAGIPSLKMTPAGVTLRHALQTAALIGSGAKLEESRIVTMIVRVPSGALPAHASPSNYWYQELKLSLHRELLRDARPMDAAVLVRDEHSYLIVTTMGSLTLATDDLTVAPFLGRISAELGLQLEVGIGLGRSTREAELNAQAAVDRAAAAGGKNAYLVGPSDTTLQLPAARHGEAAPAPPQPAKDAKAVEMLSRLAERLESDEDGERIVDAEKVAELLGVTLRTARRMLHTLVDEGLAWPMPPARSSKVGRPPRPYQLLIEKIPDERG